MNNQINRIVILLLAVVFVLTLGGCSKSIDIQLASKAQVFLSSNPEQPITITKNDEIYLILKDWLNENKEGWYATSGRYPDGVYIKSGVHGIQVTEQKVIIYSITNNEPKAIYIQQIEKGELSQIVNFAQ